MQQSTELAKVTEAPVPVLCGAVESSCKCVETPHADDIAHVCECGGSWRGGTNGVPFQIVRFPGIFGNGSLISTLIGGGW